MLIEFYGKECPHCQKVAPLVEQLKKELGISMEQYEVWHNADNLQKMREYDTGLCGGVPFFFNTDTKKYLCGETSYESLKNFASGNVSEHAHSPLQKKLDYSFIADGIYIGTNQCCDVHFDERLQKEGITADLSLEEHKVDMPFGVRFYVWIPVKNHTAPTEDQLEFGVSVIDSWIQKKLKVYVHCKNGHGRAPTFVAAYLMTKGMSLKEALRIIAEQRPATHLEDAQLRALEEFEKKILNKK